MIIVYLKKEDHDSTDILDKLRELVVAHRIVYLDENRAASVPDEPDSDGSAVTSRTAGRHGVIKPPALVDDDTIVRGRKKIFAHLEMLEGFLGEWSKFQSDACYCDADGKVE